MQSKGAYDSATRALWFLTWRNPFSWVWKMVRIDWIAIRGGIVLNVRPIKFSLNVRSTFALKWSKRQGEIIMCDGSSIHNSAHIHDITTHVDDSNSLHRHRSPTQHWTLSYWLCKLTHWIRATPLWLSANVRLVTRKMDWSRYSILCVFTGTIIIFS